MILPGLISVAFYRRRPSAAVVALGLVFTIVVSGLLGYWQDFGTPRVWENTIVAIVGGVLLYVVILVVLLYYFFPKQKLTTGSPPPTPPGPSA